MNRRRSCLPMILIAALSVVLVLAGVIYYLPNLAQHTFGAPSPSLANDQQMLYAADLLWHSADLTEPLDPSGSKQVFTIAPGESAVSISDHLQHAGLIRSASSFRKYLIWSGIDTLLQPGSYRLSPGLTAVEIASRIQSSQLTEVDFYILPGWRAEEIATALPTSGFSITPNEFLAAASHPASPPYFLAPGAIAEGFMLPGHYILSRQTNAEQLVAAFLQSFSDALTPGLRNGFASHGLTIYQAVTLASIVQRETVAEDEMPVIASVFYNRLAAGMKLETDPTVQYALGYNAAQNSWWTNPLSLDDLKIDSPYNTYVYAGLPPAPISNPGLEALQAVADPAQTDYLYFQARCDNSGRHNFAETFEQHVQNSCP